MRSYAVCFGMPDGAAPELPAGVLADFLTALQTLLYRLTREAADQAGLGRAVRPVELSSGAHVSWSEEGTLLVKVGDPDALEIDPLADATDAAFAIVLDAITLNTRPPHLTNPVADAVDGLIRVLLDLGRPVAIVLPDGQVATCDPAEIRRDPWQQTRLEPARIGTVTGRLEMVDLRSRRCRIRDPLGQAYDVHDLGNPSEAARLVGEQVAVSGVVQEGTGTQHHRIEEAHVMPLPARQPAAQQILRPAADQLDLTDDEWRTFLAAHRDDL